MGALAKYKLQEAPREYVTEMLAEIEKAALSGEPEEVLDKVEFYRALLGIDAPEI